MQPSTKLTAPADIWNNYDVARSKPHTFEEVRSKGITVNDLRSWHDLPPERQNQIDMELRKYQRHPETC